MNQEILAYVVEKTQELMNAHTCCAETKEAAKTWLDAIGTAQETEETRKYIEALEESIQPIDSLIAFSSSNEGVQYFGEETAKAIELHAKAIKAAGARYCDCPACAAVEAILEKKEELIKP